MGKLFERIKRAVREDRFLVGWHADERFEERAVTDWQIVSGFENAELVSLILQLSSAKCFPTVPKLK